MTVPWVPLGELLRPRMGGEVEPASVYPIAGVYGFGRGVLIRDSIVGAQTGYKSLTRLGVGDVVYSKLKAFEGAIACVHQEADGYYVSPEFPVFEVDPAVSWRYLEHVLQSPEFSSRLASASTGLGARRERVHPTRFLGLLVPLPSRPDQDRIAAHLASVEKRIAGLDASAPHLMGQLPQLLGKLLNTAARGVTTVQSLCANRQVVIHPGDDLKGAEEFVGLEHIESHTGRRIGGRPIGDESGRKLLFEPGQVTYGYLRPYLNKVWAADRIGLCSVEQFTLTPAEDVDARLLSVVLRSEAVWRSAQEATNNLQLPRLGLGALMAFQVPDVRGLDWEALRPASERLTTLAIRETELQRACARLQASILPAARNEIFSAMR